MRIISGKFKGRRFDPPLKRCHTRPTMDKAKEGLFNILSGYFDFDDISVLDLFGGTGSIGIEFVSRGCSDVEYVDRDYNCIKFIKTVIETLDIPQFVKVRKQDGIDFLTHTPAKYDIIFADPPYNFKNINKIIEITENRNLIKENGMLIIEHDQRNDFSQSPRFVNSRHYGTNIFSFFSFDNSENIPI